MSMKVFMSLKYYGWGRGASIKIPLSPYAGDDKITLNHKDGEKFIAMMHKYFAVELEGFDVDKESMYRFPGVILGFLAPKQS